MPSESFVSPSHAVTGGSTFARKIGPGVKPPICLWMLNEHLAADGYATVLTIQPNSRYADRFMVAVQSARDQGLGLWSACTPPSSPAVSPMPVPPDPANPLPPVPEKQVCDAAYPTVCVPPQDREL